MGMTGPIHWRTDATNRQGLLDRIRLKDSKFSDPRAVPNPLTETVPGSTSDGREDKVTTQDEETAQVQEEGRGVCRVQKNG